MFTTERHQLIIEELQINGKVKVKDLSTKFEVSEDCIRKDLKQLEFQGKCKRAYGGAILRDNVSDHNVYSRIDKDVDNKMEVAKKAFEEIVDGETIFMDVSTTNILLAQLLSKSNKRLIIISNMIEILQILASNKNITVIGTGGNVNLELNGFVGSIALNMVNKHNFNKCFMGTTGIDYEFNELTTFDMIDGLIKESVINNSQSSYILMEKKKFNMIGTYKYINVDNIDYVITNNDILEETKTYLLKHNIEIK